MFDIAMELVKSSNFGCEKETEKLCVKKSFPYTTLN
jgi:hypothetical protein